MPLPLSVPKPNFLRSVITKWQVAQSRARARDVQFCVVPEPRTVGDFTRGHGLCNGKLTTTGFEASFGDGSIWDIPGTPTLVTAQLHRFEWLDDLATYGDKRARSLARRSQSEWIEKFGSGDVLAWQPATVAYRLLRWINHSAFTGLTGSDPDQDAISSIGQHIAFLRKFWSKSAAGFDRAVALTGLICAEMSTGKTVSSLENRFAALDKEISRCLTPDGAVRSRNPEELAEVLTLLAWVFRACDDLNAVPPEDLCEKAETIGPVLRALRHGDGSLARFHGGSRGAEGQLDTALAFAGVRAETPLEDAMGFTRLTSGASSILLDTAAPANGALSNLAHASTGAMEMNYRSSPIIVSCGSALGFDPDFAMEARATDGHSTLILERQSTASFVDLTDINSCISSGPTDIPFKRTRAIDGMRVQVGHNAYLKDFGVMHARTLDLTTTGTGLVGEDMLVAQGETEEAAFQAAKSKLGRDLNCVIRFHLHPEVKPVLNVEKGAVDLHLDSGQMWTFSHDGYSAVSLEHSLYFQQALPEPRVTQQIVMSFLVSKPISRVRWSLVKSSVAS